MSLFEDPLRNGYLLCLVIHEIFDFTIKKVMKKPKTYKQILQNFSRSLKVLKKNIYFN